MKNNKVLIVDDDSSMRWMYQDIFTEAGFEVTSAEDGQKAIKCLQSEEFGAVVSDYQMPVLDGLGLQRWVRENRPTQNFLMVTGSMFMAVKKLGFKILLKPVGKEEIFEALGINLSV